MAVDHAYSWVLSGVTFNFADPYEIDAIDGDELEYDIPTATVPGGDGSYDEDSTVLPRFVTFSGMLIGDDTDDLRDKWDTFCAAFPRGAAGRLYRNSDRYLNARVKTLRPAGKDEGLSYRDWALTFKCADPFYYNAAAEGSVALATDGSNTAIATGGNVEALPVFTLVANAGGSVTVAGPNGKSFTLSPTVAGTYVIDAAAGTVTKAGADFISIFNGEFFPLPAAGGNIAITDSGVILTSAGVVWTKRWASG